MSRHHDRAGDLCATCVQIMRINYGSLNVTACHCVRRHTVNQIVYGLSYETFVIRALP